MPQDCLRCLYKKPEKKEDKYCEGPNILSVDDGRQYTHV